MIGGRGKIERRIVKWGRFYIFAGMMGRKINTVIDLLERSCEQFPGNVYLWEKKEGKYQPATYLEVREQVGYVASGLMGRGLLAGERVALLSEGCNDWIYAELGILYAGGIHVPLSIKLSPGELIFRLNHSGARFLIVSDHYAETIRGIEQEISGIEQIFVLRQTNPEEGKYTSFERLKDEGNLRQEEYPSEVEQRAMAVRPEDVATLSYTSGTTAEPKGVMLTHGNYVCNVLQSDSLIRIPEYYRILLFLPWDHSFAHTVGIYSFMYNGASLASVDFGRSPVEYLRNIPVNMKEIKPHVLLSVPAIAKNFRKNIESEISRKGKLTRWLYRWGLKLKYVYQGPGPDKRLGLKVFLWPLQKLWDRVVFAKIRRVFGGNLQFFIGGGALLDTELQRYYYALGIPMYQGYGLSEASPVISSNHAARCRFGSSGQVVQPLELKICDEEGREVPQGEKGEIVVRGGNVMKGYWKNEVATAEVIREGWLYTGDRGYLGDRGMLYVTGRFKSLLIAGDGEKFSPEGIEEAIVELSPYVDYCLLYNNQSPYTSALLVPRKTALLEYTARKGEKAGTVEAYKLMLDKLYEELMKFRKGGEYEGMFPERWLPAVVAVLPAGLSEANGTVNSTGKVVRRKVYELFREELEFVYTPEGKNIRNVRNTKNIRMYFENESICAGKQEQ